MDWEQVFTRYKSSPYKYINNINKTNQMTDFVSKINNLATQSWKKNSGLCFIEN